MQKITELSKIRDALFYQRDIKCGKILGEGVFGQVVSATKNGKAYAIKLMPCTEDSTVEAQKTIKYQMRELELLETIKLPSYSNVIKYFESWIMQVGDAKKLCIQMEYCSGSLLKFVYKNKAGPQIIQTQAKGQPRFYQQVFKQILNGLIAIHSAGWVHRDIQPGNILVVKPNPQQISDIAIKIGDFGLARYIEKEFQLSPGWTINAEDKKLSPCLKAGLYRAPEILSDTYDFKVDLYNAGIVLYFISRYLEEEESSKLHSEIEELKQGTLRINEYVYHKDDEKLCSLIENLTQRDPEKRYTALEAMKCMFPKQRMDSTDSSKVPKTEFFARKDDEKDLSRCHLNKFTLSAMREAVRFKIGVEIDWQELYQELLIHGEKKHVKVDDDEDVRAMFRTAERSAEDERNVVVVVREKPLEESNV